MSTANFYPGPSRIYSKVPEHIYEAYMSGIMSANHRSDSCMELVHDTKRLLKAKLQIPESYEIAFTSSATENWEIIAQSLTERGSFHFFNGAFGEKWYGYAGQITHAEGVSFGIHEVLPDVEVGKACDVICITQNETSNGTQVSNKRLGDLRGKYPDKIIAVDVTSSLGGVKLAFENGDYWYASVQKCLGLPAGLGVVIMSPRAMEKAAVVNEKKYYNSLLNIIENTRKNQTQYTPNVLGIYLLNKTQSLSKGIDYIQGKLKQRMNRYTSLIKELEGLDFLVESASNRSSTVLALKVHNPEQVRNAALDYGITLGAGYGVWKSSTFRIANFPAIKAKEIDKLMNFLKQRS